MFWRIVMVIVKVRDKRYYSGFRIIFFRDKKDIDSEVLDCIRKYKNAYYVDSETEHYYTRKDIEKAFDL